MKRQNEWSPSRRQLAVERAFPSTRTSSSIRPRNRRSNSWSDSIANGRLGMLRRDWKPLPPPPAGDANAAAAALHLDDGATAETLLAALEMPEEARP